MSSRNGLFAAVLAVAVFILSSSTARADGEIIIGLNGAGDLSKNANASWVRTGDWWRHIETSPGVFDFSLTDSIVNHAVYDLGQQVLFVLSGAPSWCGGGSLGNSPCDIDSWKNFVDVTTQHFAGRVAAYEIWNEPDLQNNSTPGVGWDPDLNLYPRYADYLVEAARIIKRNDMNALVVGPVVSGKGNSRTTTIFQQLENTWYPEGNAGSFLNVVSGHMDNEDDTHSEEAASFYRDNVLNKIAVYNPSNRWKEQWITEFSWRSAGIGENSQRIRLKNFLIEMTGGGFGYLSGWNFTHGFIYVTMSCDTSRSIYYCGGSPPKLVVTNYLWPLGFPAKQVPGVPRE